MVKVENGSQFKDQASAAASAEKPFRQLSAQSAEELMIVASRSPEKLRKALERLAGLAGESVKPTSRNK
ncbi:hypothetical protein AwEntero_04750 [Enterobacterales bacterium]|nr:hypothetical protein AwEntero_04750 [Enterobacterales bacterium]